MHLDPQHCSVAKPESSKAATFRAVPEPSFCWSEPRAGAPALFSQAKKSLVLVINMTKKQCIMVNMIKKGLVLIINFLRPQNEKF